MLPLYTFVYASPLYLLRASGEKIPKLGTLLYFCKILLLRVIAKKTLRDFWEKYPDAEQQLKSWYREAETAIWKNPNEIKREYPSASILEGNRVVFNIRGNHYRLIIKINYHYQMIWIRFVGTHTQYDKIDATNI
jgi:mRNA interferase HigB